MSDHLGVYLQVSNNWIPVIGHLRHSRVNYVHLDEVFLSFFLLPFAKQAPVVQKVDNAIHRINHYPLDIAIGFAITYPVDSAIHRLNNWGQIDNFDFFLHKKRYSKPFYPRILF